MDDSSDILIVTVAYNSTAVIGDLLASLPKGAQTVIVDNASTDSAELNDIASKYNASVVRNENNRGFGAGCNIGAASASSEYIFFINPDARMSPGCLEKLRRAMCERPDAAAASPNVQDNRGQPCFRKRSRLLPKSAYWTKPLPTADADVPLLNGAAMFVPRAHFEGVNGFDEAIFLYHEDDDLSLRLSQTFGPLLHVHDAVVDHAEGASTPRTPTTAAFKAWHMARSAVYAMRKHDRPFARLRVTLFAALQMLSPLNLVSARCRSKHLAFLKGALSSGST